MRLPTHILVMLIFQGIPENDLTKRGMWTERGAVTCFIWKHINIDVNKEAEAEDTAKGIKANCKIINNWPFHRIVVIAVLFSSIVCCGRWKPFHPYSPLLRHCVCHSQRWKLIAIVVNVVSAASSTQACDSSSGICVAFSIPLSSSSSSSSSDILATVQAPGSLGWVAFGFGQQMTGSLMFVMWPYNNQVIISSRLGT